MQVDSLTEKKIFLANYFNVNISVLLICINWFVKLKHFLLLNIQNIMYSIKPWWKFFFMKIGFSASLSSITIFPTNRFSFHRRILVFFNIYKNKLFLCLQICQLKSTPPRLPFCLFPMFRSHVLFSQLRSCETYFWSLLRFHGLLRPFLLCSLSANCTKFDWFINF